MTQPVDRVYFRTATVGTGSLVVGAAFKSYYRNLSTAVAHGDVADGDIIGYAIQDGDAWEVGKGTVASSGAMLERTTVLRTDDGGTSPLSLSGNADVLSDTTSSTMAELLALLDVIKVNGAGDKYLADDGTYQTVASGGQVDSVVAGANVSVDNTDPVNPIVSASVTGGGDMSKSVYDPTGIEADSFARANHTGTQTLSTISDAGDAAALDVGTGAGDVAAGDAPAAAVGAHETTYDHGAIAHTNRSAIDVVTDAGSAAEYLNAAGGYTIPAIQPVTGASLSYVWDDNITATAPDSPGGLKGNNSVDALITELYADDLTAANNDFSAIFGGLHPGDFLQVSETGGGADANNTFLVTASAVDHDGWWTLFVSSAHSDGALTNNKEVLATYVEDPKNKLPVGGLPGQPLGKETATDYDTGWLDKVNWYFEGALKGLSGATVDGKGVAMAYSDDGAYHVENGGIAALPGRLEHHGTTQYFPAMDDGSDIAQNAQIINGTLFTAKNPEPGWSLSDASSDVFSMAALNQWAKFASLSVITTATEPAAEGDLLTHQVTTSWTNIDNKAANVEIGVGVGVAEPVNGTSLPVLAAGFSGRVTVSATVVTLPGGHPEGTVFTVWGRHVISTDGTPIADGSVADHQYLLTKQADAGAPGGDGLPAPDVRVISQAVSPTDIVVAANEIVELTPDGNSIGVSFATIPGGAESAFYEFKIMSGPSAVTWTGPVAGDWPGGNVPDTSAGRHTTGCERTASGYTMSWQAHQ